jgi:hypothetical protein
MSPPGIGRAARPRPCCGRLALGAAALGGLVLGCADPPLRSCADPLDGVWRGGGEAYHVVDHGRGVEIYAMFDTTRPPTGDKRSSDEVYAPVVFDLTRAAPPGGARLAGTRSQRVTRGAKVCSIELPAEIAACGGGRITLRYELDRGVDWNRCRARQTGRWRTLVLGRD